MAVESKLAKLQQTEDKLEEIIYNQKRGYGPEIDTNRTADSTLLPSKAKDAEENLNKLLGRKATQDEIVKDMAAKAAAPMANVGVENKKEESGTRSPTSVASRASTPEPRGR